MNEFHFYYCDGSQVNANDKVFVNQTQIAWIQEVLLPKTSKALEYSCPDGGFILKFQNGDTQLWIHTDEDICLIERGENYSD